MPCDNAGNTKDKFSVAPLTLPNNQHKQTMIPGKLIIRLLSVIPHTPLLNMANGVIYYKHNTTPNL